MPLYGGFNSARGVGHGPSGSLWCRLALPGLLRYFPPVVRGSGITGCGDFVRCSEGAGFGCEDPVRALHLRDFGVGYPFF